MMSMSAKLKVYLLQYTPIGNTARNNVCFTAQCSKTKKVFKSSVFQPPLSYKRPSEPFWQFQLFQTQNDLEIKMLQVNSAKTGEQLISLVTVQNLHLLTEDTQIFFYKGSQRIGVLALKTQKLTHLNTAQNKSNTQHAQKSETQNVVLNLTKMKRTINNSDSQNSQNQRYHVDFTPHQTLNNSVVKLVKNQENSYLHILKGLNQSSIEEREPFSGDQSFQLNDKIQSRSRGKPYYQLSAQINNSQKQRQQQNNQPLGVINSKKNFPLNLKDPKEKSSKGKPIQHENQVKDRTEANQNANEYPTSSKFMLGQESSSLQKWLKKLQKFQNQKEKSSSRGPHYQCIVADKFKSNQSQKSQKQTNITVNLLNLTLDSTVNDSYCLKSLKMKAIYEKDKKLSSHELYECKFSLVNQNEQNIPKQMRFANLMASIPSDVNVQVEISLQNMDESDPQEMKICGIFLKDQLIETDRIPLFDEDQNIFASLSYKAKMLQNVSVQYLSPLESISEIYDQKKVKLLHLKEAKANQAKSLIKQRKMNKMTRRQSCIDSLSPTSSEISRNQPPRQKLLNYGVRSHAQNDIPENIDQTNDQGPKNRKDSSFSIQLQRSNTDEIKISSKYESEAANSSNSSRSPSINKLKSKIQKMQEEVMQFTGNLSLPTSPHKHQHRLRLKSTTLADLREEESQDQEDDERGHKLKLFSKNTNSLALQKHLVSRKKALMFQKLATEPDRNIYRGGQEETIHHPGRLSSFVIEINAITVILYEHSRSEMEQNGKFIILKSQSGQTFITETLFSNHLNLNWKNKFYQFSSSRIEIGIYEKASFSSQSQSKLMGRVQVKLMDLMKAIKQNFHRAEIFVKGKPIGIVILLYDIFLQRQFARNLQEESQNNTELKIKNRTQKITNITNETQYDRYNHRGSEKTTIKVGKQKNRKRAKTLQSSKKNYHLPVIDRMNNLSRRRPYQYEGGKNIAIGKVQRFSTTNMAELLGEM